MSYKKLVLFDENKNKDVSTILKNFNGGIVTIKDEDTGEVLLRKAHNKVIVGGSAFTASKHWNIKPRVYTPTYNEILGLDESVNEVYTGEGIRKEEIIFLFALGIDGCGQEASQVYKVDYTKWIAPENLIPFRYQDINNDLGASLRSKYFGKKTLPNDKIAYYFKAFENQPELIQCYTDGTPIDENIYTSERKDEVESFVEVNLKVTKDDCRDFFLSTTGINSAKVNSISLLTAYPKVIDGFVYYQNIRPLTKINFPNESLIDPSKGLDITYQVLY